MEKQIKIALAGNPNCGKTTLFNALTGSNQFVGNWPGVTVEKKEGRLKKHDDVVIMDLPGIYSLSPYTLEEVVARNYLIDERPDAILNIVDGTNLERNLYLTTQLTELGIPVVMAVNMMDIVRKSGDQINIGQLSQQLGCKVVEISALKGDGVMAAAEAAIEAAKSTKTVPMHTFSGPVEHAIAHIEEAAVHKMPEEQQRWYAIKIFERDDKVLAKLHIPEDVHQHIEADIKAAEEELDDDAESIITGERYGVIAHIIDECLTKAPAKMSTSEKIDRVVTNRILGLPIFVVIMFCVYYIAVSTLGGTVTDFTNDQLFGTDGWYVLGQGRDAYDAAVEAAGDNADSVDPAQYGPYVPGITTVVHDALVAGGTEDGGLVDSLVCDGIVGGLGAIFGFVPQMFLLFVMLSFLEDCGYMARVAFIMDRVFRRFGLSGKSFIPMLVSSGCGVPGVMATKTIENEKDRRMTVMTTTFIPCGAKLPIIALLMGSIIGDSSTTAAWISPLFYFLGVFAVIASGLMLKKTKLFAGRPTPFVMELPAYHFPAIRSWALHVWERCWAFIKKAGTVIFASTVVVWFLSNFGSYNGSFGFLPAMDGIPEEFMDYSVLAMLGNLVAWIFAPLGFSTWQATALTVSGLVAKENVVATAGSLLSVADAAETDPSLWTAFAGMFPTMGACVAFGAFNLLCAPCFAAMGTIRNQMDSGKWTAIAIGYECAFAWVIGLFINQFYNLLVLGQFGVWTVVAIVLLVAMLFQIFRPMPKHAWTDEDETNTASAAVSA